MTPQTVIFFGPSGAGKGTQAAELRAHLEASDPGRSTLTIGMGQLARAFVEAGESYTSTRVAAVLEGGKLLPSFIPIWLWSSFLVEHYSGDEHLIFDGTRRELEVAALDSALEFYGRERVDVIVLNVSREWSIERLTERGRADDKRMADIDARLLWYRSEVLPAITYLRERPARYRVHEIRGEQTIKEVHEDIKKALSL